MVSLRGLVLWMAIEGKYISDRTAITWTATVLIFDSCFWRYAFILFRISSIWQFRSTESIGLTERPIPPTKVLIWLKIHVLTLFLMPLLGLLLNNCKYILFIIKWYDNNIPNSIKLTKFLFEHQQLPIVPSVLRPCPAWVPFGWSWVPIRPIPWPPSNQDRQWLSLP